MFVNHVNEEVGKGVGKWEKWKVENGGGGKRKGETWRAKVDYVGQAMGLGVWRITESEREVT